MRFLCARSAQKNISLIPNIPRSPFPRSSAATAPICTRGDRHRYDLSDDRMEGAMKGVVFVGDRKLELREFPDPTPGPGEVVLEIKASGMCGSDLKYYRGSGGAASLGFTAADGAVIAGHEPCGVVAEN